MATAKFNQLMMAQRISTVECTSASAGDNIETCRLSIINSPLYEFDCKAWNVPNSNDAFAWLLYRQNDCIRNSKQQVCQTYLPHRELVGKNTDEQCALLLERKDVDWNNYVDGLKYGRVCYRERVTFKKTGTDGDIEYERNPWVVNDARVFGESRDRIMEIIETKESDES